MLLIFTSNDRQYCNALEIGVNLPLLLINVQDVHVPYTDGQTDRLTDRQNRKLIILVWGPQINLSCFMLTIPFTTYMQRVNYAFVVCVCDKKHLFTHSLVKCLCKKRYILLTHPCYVWPEMLIDLS